jgi:hypothetical protein
MQPGTLDRLEVEYFGDIMSVQIQLAAYECAASPDEFERFFRNSGHAGTAPAIIL